MASGFFVVLVFEEKAEGKKRMTTNQLQGGGETGEHLFEEHQCRCKIIWKAHILSLAAGKVGPLCWLKNEKS